MFPLGVLAILLGILAAAVADVRGRVAPRRAGVLLLAGWIVAFAANTTIGVGLAWLAIAALIAREPTAGLEPGDPLHYEGKFDVRGNWLVEVVSGLANARYPGRQRPP